MSMNDTYQPINCDDYDNLELACQHHLMLTLELKDGEKLQAKAELYHLLGIGLKDEREGKVFPAHQALDDIRKELNK